MYCSTKWLRPCPCAEGATAPATHFSTEARGTHSSGTPGGVLGGEEEGLAAGLVLVVVVVGASPKGKGSRGCAGGSALGSPLGQALRGPGTVVWALGRFAGTGRQAGLR